MMQGFRFKGRCGTRLRKEAVPAIHADPPFTGTWETAALTLVHSSSVAYSKTNNRSFTFSSVIVICFSPPSLPWSLPLLSKMVRTTQPRPLYSLSRHRPPKSLQLLHLFVLPLVFRYLTSNFRPHSEGWGWLFIQQMIAK